MTIILACFAGMSTSMLVKKIETAAEKRSMDIAVEALPASSELSHFEKADIILLAPQARYLLDEFRKNLSIPIDVIPMDIYGTMNGDKLLDLALKHIK